MARKPDVGEFWAYRIGRKLGRPFTQVEVVEHPKNRKVVIRHVDSDELEEVPLQRLVVPWDESGRFAEDERNLQAVHDTPWGEYDQTHFDAAILVARYAYEYPAYSIQGWPDRPGLGSLTCESPEQLSQSIGMSREEMLALPNAYVDRQGTYRAPFVATVEITKRFCEHNPTVISTGTRVFEEELNLMARGELYLGDMPINTTFAGYELEQYRPALELLRSWAGEEENSELDEIESLRQEVRRLQNLVSDIGNVFYQHGYQDIARSVSNVLEESSWGTE